MRGLPDAAWPTISNMKLFATTVQLESKRLSKKEKKQTQLLIRTYIES